MLLTNFLKEKDELKRSYEEKESMLMLQQKELVKKKDDLEEKIHQAEKDMLDKEHEIAHLKEVVMSGGKSLKNILNFMALAYVTPIFCYFF